jgi:GntP family gluconate:H+ symporter
LALLPILLTVFLLGVRAMTDAAFVGSQDKSRPAWLARVLPSLDNLGDKQVALISAAAVALWTLYWQKRKRGRASEIPPAVQSALASGGVIILITAAGGAFGHVLRQSGIAAAIEQYFPPSQGGLTLLAAAFAITAIVRFAQGSATVAMITAVSIISPLAASVPLPYHPLYLALAIGCGSKPFPWMNDSGLWVVGKMSGMTEAETLKIHSVALTIMGVVGFAATVLGAKLLPLV